MTFRGFFAALFVLLLMSANVASAASTVTFQLSTLSWQDIGTCPCRATVQSGTVVFYESDSGTPPSVDTPGHTYLPNQIVPIFNTTNHVYARAMTRNTTIGVSYEAGYGGAAAAANSGGGSNLPLIVKMTVTNATVPGNTTQSQAALPANGSRKYLELYNEGSQCRFSYDTAPSSTSGMPLPPGAHTLEASVISTQSLWFYCPTTSQIDITEGQ